MLFCTTTSSSFLAPIGLVFSPSPPTMEGGRDENSCILSPHSTTTTTTTTSTVLVPQHKKRSRSPTVASPNNNAPTTLPSDRCTRNDGKRWRCPHPCLPGSCYCDKHHKYFQLRQPTKQKHRPSTPGVLMPSSVEEKLEVKEEEAAAFPTSSPLPTVPPGFKVIECRPQPPSQVEKKPMIQVQATQASMPPKVPSSTPATRAEKPPVVKEEVASPTMPPPPKTLRVGEVWALPASLGGPPRAYARIDRIIHASGQAEVRLLTPHPVSNEEIGWAEEGRTLACGTFRATSHPSVINISSLSHRVTYSEVGKSFFKILPMAGEVWAVYDTLEMDSACHLVEIMSGFTEEGGTTTAARLVLAEGGRRFKRELHGQYHLRRTFLRRDLLWFSHRVLAVKDAAGCGGQWKVFS